jgi:hypothetical protein
MIIVSTGRFSPAPLTRLTTAADDRTTAINITHKP